MLTPEIIEIPEKLLVGMRLKMSYTKDLTQKLFGEFMPLHKQVLHAANQGFFAVHIYEDDFQLQHFTPHTIFEKWAAVEVTAFETLPPNMESLTIPSGKYALFVHKGLGATFPQTIQYIYQEWLPNAPYEYDNRPYFERMGEKYYGFENPESEEEIWVPIK